MERRKSEERQEKIIICVASELQFETNRTGVGWTFSSEARGVILSKARVHNTAQNPWNAELEAIRQALVEAQNRCIKNVEVRVDTKTMVA